MIFCLEFGFINKICISHMTWGSLVDIIYLKKRSTSFMTYGCLLACLSLMITKGQQPLTRAPLETSQFWYFSCSLSSILVSSSIHLSIWMCASCEFNVCYCSFVNRTLNKTLPQMNLSVQQHHHHHIHSCATPLVSWLVSPSHQNTFHDLYSPGLLLPSTSQRLASKGTLYMPFSS